MSLHDDVADMMARSFTVGRHHTREEILARLKANYPTEDALRALMATAKAAATAVVDAAEDNEYEVVSVAQMEGDRLVTPKDVPRFKCPVCGQVSYNADDIAQRYCSACKRGQA